MCEAAAIARMHAAQSQRKAFSSQDMTVLESWYNFAWLLICVNQLHSIADPSITAIWGFAVKGVGLGFSGLGFRLSRTDHQSDTSTPPSNGYHKGV